MSESAKAPVSPEGNEKPKESPQTQLHIGGRAILGPGGIDWVVEGFDPGRVVIRNLSGGW